MPNGHTAKLVAGRWQLCRLRGGLTPLALLAAVVFVQLVVLHGNHGGGGGGSGSGIYGSSAIPQSGAGSIAKDRAIRRGGSDGNATDRGDDSIGSTGDDDNDTDSRDGNANSVSAIDGSEDSSLEQCRPLAQLGEVARTVAVNDTVILTVSDFAT